MAIQLSVSNTLSFRMLTMIMVHYQQVTADAPEIAQVDFPVLPAPFSADKEVKLKGTLTDGGTFMCTCRMRKQNDDWLPVNVRLAVAENGHRGGPFTEVSAEFTVVPTRTRNQLFLKFTPPQS